MKVTDAIFHLNNLKKRRDTLYSLRQWTFFKTDSKLSFEDYLKLNDIGGFEQLGDQINELTDQIYDLEERINLSCMTMFVEVEKNIKYSIHRLREIIKYIDEEIKEYHKCRNRIFDIWSKGDNSIEFQSNVKNISEKILDFNSEKRKFEDLISKKLEGKEIIGENVDIYDYLLSLGNNE